MPPLVALQVQHVQVHAPVRCTAAWVSSSSCDSNSMWDWIRMCLWSCACGHVCCQGFPWGRHSTGADPAGGKAMIYSFAAHISLSSHTSPAVFTSACTGHRFLHVSNESGWICQSFFYRAFNLVDSDQTASCCRCHGNVFRPVRISFSE